MPFCQSCGNEYSSGQKICSNCGANLQGGSSPQYRPQPAPDDTGGFGWGLLGFCVPVAGLVLYLVWMNEKPNNAKAAGMGALVSVIMSVVMMIFYMIAIAAATSM